MLRVHRDAGGGARLESSQQILQKRKANTRALRPRMHRQSREMASARARGANLVAD